LRRSDGATVIAKRPAEELGLRSELAAYTLLPADTRADLLAEGQGVLVMEDLGNGPSLADLLLGPDADAATAGLLAWARGVVRMAATTPGRAPEGDEPFPRRGDIEAPRTLALAE
jgi:hypothetical protein